MIFFKFIGQQVLIPGILLILHIFSSVQPQQGSFRLEDNAYFIYQIIYSTYVDSVCLRVTHSPVLIVFK